jgi:hypothetical protein
MTLEFILDNYRHKNNYNKFKYKKKIKNFNWKIIKKMIKPIYNDILIVITNYKFYLNKNIIIIFILNFYYFNIFLTCYIKLSFKFINKDK